MRGGVPFDGVAQVAHVGLLVSAHHDQEERKTVVLFGHDVFTGLVTQAGWSVPEYKAWLLTTLAHQLLQRPN